MIINWRRVIQSKISRILQFGVIGESKFLSKLKNTTLKVKMFNEKVKKRSRLDQAEFC